MIKIYIGNIGSGKTANAVRELYYNKSDRKTYSNIITKKIKNNIVIDSSMIIKEDAVDTITRKSGKTEQVIKKTLNQDFWKNVEKPCNVVLDEAHSILNSRRAMSKTNQIITEWLALLRRILGSNDAGYGELTLITQLDNRIDIIARDMATLVKYHKCHFRKTCQRCFSTWNENSDIPEPVYNCPSCGSPKLKKSNFVIEVMHFRNIEYFRMWKEQGMKTFHARYYINDIEIIFPMYDTLQWDNLFTDSY
jgi:hypothetical protein